MAAESHAADATSAVWWRDPRYRAWIFQVVALAAVLGIGWYLVSNTVENMEKRGIASGFDFLETTAGFGIIQTLIPYAETSSYFVALVVGFLNTILIAFVGVILATMIGFTIGIARLSNNWLVRKLATIYIETFRNIPLLLQILFWYVAVLKPLPGPNESVNIFGIRVRHYSNADPICRNIELFCRSGRGLSQHDPDRLRRCHSGHDDRFHDRYRTAVEQLVGSKTGDDLHRNLP